LYKLHIANKNYSSWSLRPWVLMAELGIPFEEILTPFSNDSNRRPFAHFSPTAKVPCLYDGEIAVWDSLAICEYLAEVHGRVWPEDRTVRAWARCVAAEMHSGFDCLRSLCGMNVGVRIRLHEVPADLVRDIDRIDDIWREGLSRFGGPFLTGAAFCAVDAFFAPVVFRCQTYDLAISKQANAYCRQLLTLSSMQAWESAALSETWRDDSHESEILRYGRIVEDRRQVAD
jgi:glutathione S-transferase